MDDRNNDLKQNRFHFDGLFLEKFSSKRRNCFRKLDEVIKPVWLIVHSLVDFHEELEQFFQELIFHREMFVRMIHLEDD